MDKPPLHYRRSLPLRLHNWQPACHRLLRAMPTELRPELLDNGSLTRRVQHFCQQTVAANQANPFNVQLLRQYTGKANIEEQRRLHIPHNRWALLREVQLRCNEQPWIFARTVLPLPTIHGPGRKLSRLGRRPLGEALFSDPHVRRGPMEFTELKPCHSLFARIQQTLPASSTESETLWGRRSCFWVGGEPLLVAEFFLADYPPVAQPEQAS